MSGFGAAIRRAGVRNVAAVVSVPHAAGDVVGFHCVEHFTATIDQDLIIVAPKDLVAALTLTHFTDHIPVIEDVTQAEHDMAIGTNLLEGVQRGYQLPPCATWHMINQQQVRPVINQHTPQQSSPHTLNIVDRCSQLNWFPNTRADLLNRGELDVIHTGRQSEERCDGRIGEQQDAALRRLAKKSFGDPDIAPQMAEP